MSSDRETRDIHEQWHRMISSQDLDGLMALYAEDATLESAAILVLEGEAAGILKGKIAIRKHFGSFFAMIKDDDSIGLYHPEVSYTDGRNSIWEYPSQSLSRSQLDVVESVDLVDGKIVYHRVYWGWIGFKALLG